MGPTNVYVGTPWIKIYSIIVTLNCLAIILNVHVSNISEKQPLEGKGVAHSIKIKRSCDIRSNFW